MDEGVKIEKLGKAVHVHIRTAYVLLLDSSSTLLSMKRVEGSVATYVQSRRQPLSASIYKMYNSTTRA